MAELGYEFDAEQVEPQQDRSLIAPGEYTAQIVASEMKPTSNGTGHFLNLEWLLTDEGPHQNRRMWTCLNLDNPSTEAVRIAQQELSSICRAVGKLRVADSSELHDLPCIIKVRIRPAKDRFPESNGIVSYKAIENPAPLHATPVQRQATAPVQRAAPAPSRQPVAAAGVAAGSPPWKRG